MDPVLLVATIAIAAFALFFAVAWLAARRRYKATARQRDELGARVDVLSKYEGVHDAVAEEQRVREEARRLVQEARAEATHLQAHARQEGDNTIAAANAAAEEAREQRERLLQQAQTEASHIEARARQEASEAKSAATATVKEANEQRERLLRLAQEEAHATRLKATAEAQKIAGAAWEAKENAEKYELTAKAMRNIIEGYGDEYLIPNISLLDELAEDFSHKDAGVQLKSARAQTRAMITANAAAECDYKEARRRETAINFVIDAFNGKVDSILSKVRHNNYGKLKQEIQDAFRVVNINGEAFRNARIAEAFLAARLEELRWAVATNELQLQEREEQRQIKQAMREEERARREYEKAMKQAQKEERMLEKAMAEARKQLESAHAEERDEYQRKLAELQEKWEEAETRNQRALSMAQQTQRGHVYVISNIGSFGENVYKIGLTRRLEPMERIKELGDASVPFPFDVHAMIYSDNAPALETKLHKKFQDAQINKVNPRKEFFRIGIGDIRASLEADQLEAHWTMKAEAAEYRESLAMERPRETASGPLRTSEGDAHRHAASTDVPA